MQNPRSAIIALAAIATLASIASADVILPVSLNGGMGSRSATSVLAIEAAPAYNWSLDLSTMAATGLTGSLFGMPFAMPLYGANPADLVMAGSYGGAVPGNLVTRNFVFTDLGAVTPAYNFTVSLDLLADRTIQTTINVTGLGSFMPGGIIPSNPAVIPVSSVNASGAASIVAVPAPGAAVLAGLGGLLVFGKRRRPSAV